MPGLKCQRLTASSAAPSSIGMLFNTLVSFTAPSGPISPALNAMLSRAALREHFGLDAVGRRMIADAVDRGGMSTRGVHRAVRVARTIAGLAGAERATVIRIAEALQYRAHETRRIASAF